MDKITDSMLNSEEKGYSIRLPAELHSFLKARAALAGITKDQYFKELLIKGFEK